MLNLPPAAGSAVIINSKEPKAYYYSVYFAEQDIGIKINTQIKLATEVANNFIALIKKVKRSKKNGIQELEHSLGQLQEHIIKLEALKGLLNLHKKD